VAAISIEDWGTLAGNRRVGVWGGAELSPSSMGDWGLAPEKILKFTSMQMQISAYLK